MLFLPYQINRTVKNENIRFWRLSSVTQTHSTQLQGTQSASSPAEGTWRRCESLEDICTPHLQNSVSGILKREWSVAKKGLFAKDIHHTAVCNIRIGGINEVSQNEGDIKQIRIKNAATQIPVKYVT